VSLVLDTPALPKPEYLKPVTLTAFNTKLTRITGQPRTPFTALNGGGVCRTDVRQHYNDDQAWNADRSLIALQNQGPGASPDLIFLDGQTFLPKYVKCPNYRSSDDRWQPDPAHKNERISVRSSTLEWFDVVNCTQTRSWTLPCAGTRFNDEIVAVKLDGSKAVERYAQDHTDATDCCRCQAHPVTSRDGRRVIFASSWTLNCGSVCGSKSNPQAYVVEALP
jgi:hypothetical protein